ncbi:protein sidekick homolog [Panulirus ornatus]|uniref:protein sidekick homolog n=1 Tax=Panulirus ornatus TaxID=150431 RepID=UPI003A89DD24
MRGIIAYLAAALALCSAQNLGHIENLQQTNNGKDFITLEWDFVEGDTTYVLHKYTLLTDNDFSEDIRCPASHCKHDVEYLPACSSHYFELTPHFDDPATGGDVLGDTVNTNGNTADDIPGAPSNLAIVEDNDVQTTVQWNPPTDFPKCVDHYSVCFRLDEEDDTVCYTASDTSLATSDPLQSCGLYHVTVTPVTPSGAQGSPLEETINVRDGVPGQPEDVVVGLITKETIELKWNNPHTNPLCVFRYAITYGKTHSRVVSSPAVGREYQHHATISPLDPCSNYTIDIVAVNKAELSSPSVTRFAATMETEPDAPPTITLDPSGTDTIDVSWGANEDDRCAGHFEICWLDGVHMVEICENITTGGDNNFTITDLLPCSRYNIVITVVSPGGLTSIPTGNTTSTQDVTPSPVVNLKVASTGVNELTVNFEPPKNNPQCVRGYEIDVFDQDLKMLQTHREVTPYMDISVTDLKACTHYLVKVRSVSPTGRRSGWRQVTTKTSDDTPSAPQVFGISGFTKTSISLQWFQPEINPRCTSLYMLHWEGDGNAGNVEIPRGSDWKVTHTVTGLTACVPYTFTLKAKSSTGESDPVQLEQSTEC